MATTVREYSLDDYLLERLRFSRIKKANLEGLAGLFRSLKNRYGIAPFAAVADGHAVANGLTARYLVESITLNRGMNIWPDSRAFTR